MSQDLAAYIQAARAKGMSDDAVRTVLQNMGYPQADVAAAFAQLAGGAAPASPLAQPAAVQPAVSTQPAAQTKPVVALTGVATATGGGAKKKLLWAGAIAIIVALVGGGAAAAYFYFFAAPAPEEALAKMVANMRQVHSFSYKLDTRNEAQDPDGGTSSYSVNSVGAVDRLQAFQANSTLGITTGDLQGSATFEVRALGDKIFIKLTNMSQLGFVGAFLGPFQGQWVELDLAAATSTAAQFGVQVDVDAGQLDPAKIADVQEALWNNFPIVITADLGVEEVEGAPAYHYSFRLDEARLTALAREIAAISGEPVDEAELRDAVQSALDAAEGKSELWIDKKSFFLRKVSFNESTTLVLGGFNQDMPVTAPEDAKPLQEILDSLFGSVEEVE